MIDIVNLIEPNHVEKAVINWPDITGITLDEFYQFDRCLRVDKYSSADKCYKSPKSISIEKACNSIRKKKDTHLYSINISTNDKLDPHFELPQFIAEVSLFPRYFPDYKSSKYFRKNHKIFQAYQNYISPPQVSYGGLVEWLYVTKGHFTVTLYRPTSINITRFQTLEEGQQFIAEEGTTICFTVRTRGIVIIPPGWISVKEAKNYAFVYSGKILTYCSVPNQLEIFKRDVANSRGRFAFEIDSEIRALYWFFSANVIPSKYTPEESKNIWLFLQHQGSINVLKNHLKEWREETRRLTQSSCFSTEVFVPNGINDQLIVRDMRDRKANLQQSDKSAPTDASINTDKSD